MIFVLRKGINIFEVDQSFGVTQLCCPYRCHRRAAFFFSLVFHFFVSPSFISILPHPHLRTILQPHFMLLHLPSFLLSGISGMPSHPCADFSILFQKQWQRSHLIAHSYCFGGIFFLHLFFPLIFPNNSSDYLFTSKKPMSFGFPGSISKKMESF